MAASVSARHPGATVIADVKASSVLFDEIARLGGVPLMWKTGHSLIKTKMAETGALLAGEMSGHMFFADEYFGYDDGLYAAVRLLALLSQSKESLSALRLKLPKMHSTPEMRIDCADEAKFAVMDEVKKALKKSGARFSDVDGVRVMNEDGWWLLRASNTQAALVARCESKTPEGLARLQDNLKSAVQAQGVQVGERHVDEKRHGKRRPEREKRSFVQTAPQQARQRADKAREKQESDKRVHGGKPQARHAEEFHVRPAETVFFTQEPVAVVQDEPEREAGKRETEHVLHYGVAHRIPGDRGEQQRHLHAVGNDRMLQIGDDEKGKLAEKQKQEKRL
jgi:hypothetical protein